MRSRRAALAERVATRSRGRRERNVDRQDRKRRVGSSAIDRGRIERTGAVDRSDELSFVKVQSAAVAQVGSTATTNAIAQGGGSGQAFVNPGQTAYAFSTALPDKAYAATLIDGAHNVAGALLGPRDMVFGTAILGANYAPDGGGESHTYSASSTFDFGYGGDLMLGLIDRSGKRLRRRARLSVDGIHHYRQRRRNSRFDLQKPGGRREFLPR